MFFNFYIFLKYFIFCCCCVETLIKTIFMQMLVHGGQPILHLSRGEERMERLFHEITKLLLDKCTQADSNQISLVQVDLEQIKYIIHPTFQDQIEMQVNRQIIYLRSINHFLSLLIQALKHSYLKLQKPVEQVETSKQYMCIQT